MHLIKTPSQFIGLTVSAILTLTSTSLLAQAPDVKIVSDLSEQLQQLVEKANKLRDDGKLISISQVEEQMARESCDLQLPAPSDKKLADREIWRQAQAGHVRVGWHYLCNKCNNWHQNLAGGYFITEDGVIATCHHVVKPSKEMREGFLVMATEDGMLYPVTEVLACNEDTDTAIIRAEVDGKVTPLPLNANVYPGDPAWCYSDPLKRSCYFSKGMVNRFYMHGSGKKKSARLEVSTDWAPGSSGSAVLDECGNAIGQVSSISSDGVSNKSADSQKPAGKTPIIVFHCAARAADVIALVKAKK